MIDEYQRKFLDDALARIKNPEVRWNIVDLLVQAISALEKSQIDVVILPARRMACIYALLKDAGLGCPGRGEIYSDRYVEKSLGFSHLSGKRVAIVDDVAVTGRTLRKLRNRVLENAPDVLEVGLNVAVQLDTMERESNELNSLKISPIKISGELVHELAEQLAACLGEGLIPIFTDYPVSKKFVWSATQFKLLLDGTTWTTADVTTAPLAMSGIRSFSLVPPDDLNKEFGEFIGLDVDFQILKLRVFVQDHSFNPVFRLVPIANPSGRLTVSFDKDSGNDGVVAYCLAIQFCKYLKSKGHDWLTEFEVDPLYQGLSVVNNSSITSIQNCKFQVKEVFEWRENSRGRLLQFREQLFKPGHYVIGDDLVKPLVDHFDKWFGGQGASHTDKTFRELSDIYGDAKLAHIAIDILHDIGIAVPRSMNGQRVYRPGESHAATDAQSRILGGKYASRLDSIVWDRADGSYRPLL